ncbi:MAG: GntR family transcriptional regulator [Chloroflexi bacterium]|nr:GntR family transcriptional regulator [Chloroflexota bacterium]
MDKSVLRRGSVVPCGSGHHRPLSLVRAGSAPLHRQISDALRLAMEAGRWQPGDLLPSEAELRSRYGVSRGTIRQALATLRAEGAIHGSRGRPAVVRAPSLSQPFNELLSFSAWARSLGRSPSARVVGLEERRADSTMAAALGLDEGSPVIHLVRLRLADKEPLMLERTTFPPQVGSRLFHMDLEGHSIYESLAAQGIVVASARQRIDAIGAPTTDARLLGVASRSPLLRVRRIAFGPDGGALESADDRYRSDRVSFTVDNSAGRAPLVRGLIQAVS